MDFSIVIPTLGRAHSLSRLLRRLSELDYSPGGFEVLVVDDGNPEPLDELVAGSGGSLPLRLLRQENRGPAAARNLAARQAGGRYLAFTDDDCLPDSNWLKEIEEAARGSPDAVCGGKTVNDDPANLPAQATQLLMDFLCANYNPVSTAGAFYPANNMAVPREEFLRMGGFDEELRFGEDREFCHRWRSRGGRFVYAQQAVVRHTHNLSLRAFVRLHFLYGEGTGRFRQACRAKKLERPGFSSPRWYWKLIRSGLDQERGWRGIALSGLLAVSQASAASGVLWASLATSRKREGNHGIR
ncbi:MAG TPA: glycosyltransferase [Bryobacteraceae bacterium]|nr:glycosyltransferase [Bryobacteraceae bacterium]